MQLTRKVASVAIIVLFTASLTLMIMPVQAQYTNMQDSGSVALPANVTPDETYETIAHLSFRPNPVGAGQPLLVNLWMQPPLNVVRYYKAAFIVTFTKPDGTTSKVGPLNSFQGDTSTWFEQTVDQVGTWQIKFDFLGGYFPPGNYSNIQTGSGGVTSTTTSSFPKSVYYKPSSNGPFNFTVQSDMVASWQPSPLPTDYWTRPASPENREWWPILGNYPGTGILGGGPNWPADTNTYMSNYLYTPYVQGPTTSHIVWKKEGAIGGLVGGVWGIDYQPVQGQTDPNIIYDGKCYQAVTKVFDGQTQSVWQCYDLRTGAIYWEKTGITQPPTFITYRLPQMEAVPGAISLLRGNLAELVYVGSGRYIRYDPETGAATVNVTISPLTTGTPYMDPYFLSVQTIGSGTAARYRLINWTVSGSISGLGFTNFAMAIVNNITWPFSSLGIVDYETGIAVSTAGITPPGAGVAYGQRLMGASITTGQLLWNVTTDSTIGTQGFFSGSTAVADHGKYAVRLNDGHWHAWDLYSGKELWTSELSSWPWGTFGCYGVQSYGGMIISNQYDGVAAYNWTNGKLVWLYQAKAPYPYETPYQDNNPWFTGASIIGDGKLYAYNTEHTPSQPITRGWRLHCINITTGSGIWNITGSMAPGAIADGYLEASNGYDGYNYFFGKGKSATTVTAPDVVIPKGNGVVIRGMVLDQSPAQPGTPCVSRDSMTIQMEYLHMQHPIDGINHNVVMTGVPVTLTAIDENGTYFNIGTVTTSAYYGTFEKAWTPQAEGTYKILASFAGDDSYGSSGAATAVSVGPAPAAIQFPEQTAPIDYTMTIIGGVIAVIIAVAMVGIVLYRKKN
jgi:hypothetical protein